MSIESKPVLRVWKIKAQGRSTPQSVGGHLARSRPTPNADPDRTCENVWLVGGSDIEPRIDQLLAKAGIDRARLRHDATLANDILLTVSPQWFRPNAPDEHGESDPARLATFRSEAEAFLREKFGRRLIAAVLHVDEATPHVQAIVVPILRGKDGTGWRLSGKDTFNPSSLTALQQAWEDRLTPHGVSPRLRGSTARHTTLKAFYASVGASPDVPEIIPSPSPAGSLLEGFQARQDRVKEWQQGEARAARRKLKPLAASAAKGALYEAERSAGNAARTRLSDEYRIQDRLREEVARLEAIVDLDKAEIARLRGLSINQVTTALGYTDEITKRENPIDLVKRIGGLTSHQAMCWLHHAFGPDAVAAAASEKVRQNFADSPPPMVQTVAERIKAKAITEQLRALGAPSYRITVMRNMNGEQIGQNLGKREDNLPEKFYSCNEIISMLPLLTSHNARGGNLFITPQDPHARYVLIDDLTAIDLDHLRNRGYRPSLVVESSPGNHQAIVKVSSSLDEHATNEWFKQLNREIGDEKITGLIHPFRLAGFQNRKSKYETEGRYPFVRVVEATGQFCAHARSVIQALTQSLYQPTESLLSPT